ncbi:MAG: glycogen synthase [Proteobacteria bacterium]|nr:glycogen synthase [Pseudomonadota bacterium]
MQILFVASELAPHSASGETAQVVAALAKALRALGHGVTVLSPLYRNVDAAGRSLARRLTNLRLKLGEAEYTCELYDGRTAGGVDLLFVGHAEWFATHEPTAPETPAQAFTRTALLCRSAVAIARDRQPAFDILHAHGWGGALSTVWSKRDDELSRLRSVLSLHDIKQQGLFKQQQLVDIEAARELLDEASTDHQRQEVNLLEEGILAADRVVAGSATHARQIVVPGCGQGLEGRLAARGSDLVGIVHGIDVSVWNPVIDAHLPARFGPTDLTGKTRCKLTFQRTLELPVEAQLPLAVFASEASRDKGADLLIDAAPSILQNNVQLCVLCPGHGSVDLSPLEALQERFGDRLRVVAGVREAQLRQALAASDFLLLPARYEPYGLMQMHAQRYGSLPIVRATGGLADTIVDCNSKLETGNGFVFDEADAEELVAATRRALACFARRHEFENLRCRVMRLDNSWERRARTYESLYRGLTASPSTA